jgi:hypothetical protein
MLVISSSGSFKNTNSFLDSIIRGNLNSRLAGYAEEGVAALRAATPQDSGLTADSWGYEIVDEGGLVTIWWTNTNTINGFNVAIGLQYGHGTGNGGWVEGQDYMNPVLKPIFDKIATNVWKEVQSA